MREKMSSIFLGVMALLLFVLVALLITQANTSRAAQHAGDFPILPPPTTPIANQPDLATVPAKVQNYTPTAIVRQHKNNLGSVKAIKPTIVQNDPTKPNFTEADTIAYIKQNPQMIRLGETQMPTITAVKFITMQQFKAWEKDHAGGVADGGEVGDELAAVVFMSGQFFDHSTCAYMAFDAHTGDFFQLGTCHGQ